MNKDYIPSNDDLFNHWLTAFNAWVIAHGATHGLTPQQTGDLSTAVDAWSDRWSDFNNAKTAFHAMTQDKDSAREAAEALARADAAIIQKNPATTDADREAAGITVPKGTHTPSTTPDTAPMLQKSDTNTRGAIQLFIADSATPESRAKPANVRCVEIYEQIGGTAPTDQSKMTMLGSETRMPYHATFDPEDFGKPVWFAFRWIGKNNERGPWSAIYAMVIPG